MKTAILTFGQFLGKKDIGSSRIRGRWIWQNWEKAGENIGTCEEYKMGGQYDCVIFQKAYWVDFAKTFQGIKILDLCDPDWRDWGGRIIEMISYCDAVTCSSEAIKAYLETLTDKPIFFVADRIDFSVLPEPKKHEGKAEAVVWYGYSQNFPALDSAIPVIMKEKLELIVVSDKTYIPKTSTLKTAMLTNYTWNELSAYQDIQRGDIVINPQFKTGNWQYKSNNKTTLAWALGLPVAFDSDDLKRLVNPIERQKEAQEKYEEARRDYNILKSVEEIKSIISLVVAKRHGNRD